MKIRIQGMNVLYSIPVFVIVAHVVVPQLVISPVIGFYVCQADNINVTRRSGNGQAQRKAQEVTRGSTFESIAAR